MASRPNGFTLLEMLAALAIFAMVITVLAQGVHFGLLATRANARVAAANDGLNETDLALRHLIEAIDPGATDAGQSALSAGRHAMTFVTHLPNTAGQMSDVPVEATLLVDKRQRIEAVSRWLGHTDVRVTQRHYAFLEAIDLQAELPPGA